MRQKLTEYVDAIFRSAALTVRNAELKEEIMQNTLEKYDDLLADGKSPEEAYRAAVDGIGDISQLIEPAHIPPQPKQEQAVSVQKGGKQVKVEVHVEQDADADDFAQRKRLLNSAIGAIWLVCIALYFVWSFASGAWYITWIVFLLTPGLTQLLTAAFYWNVPEKRRMVRSNCIGAMWMFMTAAYFVVSFQTGAWYITWVMFLIAAALAGLLNACFDLGRESS